MICPKAKAAQIPKDIIDRNIKKASDKTQGDYSEVVYEAYGPGNTGFVVEALTDNVNRSASGGLDLEACRESRTLLVPNMPCDSSSLFLSAFFHSTAVRVAITRGGGKVADPGSVLFNFQRQVSLLSRLLHCNSRIPPTMPYIDADTLARNIDSYIFYGTGPCLGWTIHRRGHRVRGRDGRGRSRHGTRLQ